MTVFKNAFALLQQIGKSLMLPVSVLPVAGILLGVGSANLGWLPETVSRVMAQSGGAIFGNLALIFAIGVALGLTKNDGVAALAAVVGYAVLQGALGVFAAAFGIETKAVMGIKSIETGVLGGILIGGIAAALFNRYYRIQLPPYLGFFAGKRFVPIVTALAAIGLALVLIVIWPPVGLRIRGFANWAASERPSLAFAIYGVVERLLIPFGLHHIWNVPFFFGLGQYTDPATGEIIRGEIHRYAAGDPTAGNMAGGYLFKMWGLPAAAFAIWRMQAIFGTRAENLKTDLEEYLKTAGPEADLTDVPRAQVALSAAVVATAPEDDRELATRGSQLIGTLGGAADIAEVEPCAETRLRLVLFDEASVDEAALRTAGAWGVMRVADRTLHLLVGLHADRYAAQMKAQLAATG